MLEKNNQIDFIILSELLEGKIEVKTLIEKIRIINKEIKIIIILEKEKKELENILVSKGNIYIFYNNEVEISQIANLIIEKVNTQKLENEIEELKRLIINQDIKEEANKTEETILDKEIISIEKQIEKEYKQEKYRINIFDNNTQEKQAKIISVLGLQGVGKSIFTVNIAKALKHNKKQTLIIDLDTNNSIQTLFGLNKIRKFAKTSEKYNINPNKATEELLININKNIDVLSKRKLQTTHQNNINKLQLTKIISELEQRYDVIIIDTNFQENYEETLSDKIDKIIFLTEANILQIKKTNKMLKTYIENKAIDKKKINIIFNKNKEDSIDFYILKEIYKDYNILGKINNIKNCNTLINENMKSRYLEKQIKRQYSKIAKIILRSNNLKQYYLNKVRD